MDIVCHDQKLGDTSFLAYKARHGYKPIFVHSNGKMRARQFYTQIEGIGEYPLLHEMVNHHLIRHQNEQVFLLPERFYKYPWREEDVIDNRQALVLASNASARYYPFKASVHDISNPLIVVRRHEHVDDVVRCAILDHKNVGVIITQAISILSNYDYTIIPI